MNEQNAVAKPAERAIEYVPFGGADKIKLTVAIIQNLVAVPTKSGKTCTERDAMKFLMLCQAQRLNPFAGDAFLVGYDGQNGPSFSLITAHQAFLKRAEVNPDFDGMESGILVRHDDDTIEERHGDFHLAAEADNVVGGWARVHHKQRKFPTMRKVRMQRFNNGFAQWKVDAAGMIVKCAEADALRSTFPTMMGGLYLREEMNANAIEVETSKPLQIAAPNISTDDGDIGPQRKPGRPRKTLSDAGTVPTPATPVSHPHAAAPEPAVSPAPASESPSPVRTVKDDTINALIENGVSFGDFRSYLNTTGIAKDADSFGSFEELPAAIYNVVQGATLAKIVKIYGQR